MKYFKEPYQKPHYRITITPLLFWEIQYIWVLKHWGKDRVREGGYKHKFFDYGDVLYYRVDEA